MYLSTYDCMYLSIHIEPIKPRFKVSNTKIYHYGTQCFMTDLVFCFVFELSSLFIIDITTYMPKHLYSIYLYSYIDRVIPPETTQFLTKKNNIN